MHNFTPTNAATATTTATYTATAKATTLLRSPVKLLSPSAPRQRSSRESLNSTKATHRDFPSGLLNPRHNENPDFDPAAILATRTLGSASRWVEDDPTYIRAQSPPPTPLASAEVTGEVLGVKDKSRMDGSGTSQGNSKADVHSVQSTTESPQRSAPVHSSPSSHSHAVHPATVPVRTSSAVYSPSPKKRRSLNSVTEERLRRHASKLPEVDERNWLVHGEDYKDMSDRPQQVLDPAGAQPFSSTDSFDEHTTNWSREKENILKGPFEYVESHPGKDIRTQLIAAFNAWLQVPAASLAVITRVVGMLHTASLLVDDVEDDSKLRRGVPVAHSIFGTAQTINSANYVYFCALQELLKLDNPEVIRIYTEELLNLHRGQGMDLFWRDTLTCPSEDDYLEMVGNKTGGLFRLAIKLMCAESPSHHSPAAMISQPSANEASSSSSTSNSTIRGLQKPDYIPLVNTIGLLFQILDDYLNLSSDVYTTNKGLCEDLTEGKFSFPIIHAIRSEPQNLVLINILKQKPRDDDVKRYAVAFMERCGSFAYTRRILRGLLKKAQTLVEEVDGGRGKADGMRDYLEKLRVERLSSSGGKNAVGKRESARAP